MPESHPGTGVAVGGPFLEEAGLFTLSAEEGFFGYVLFWVGFLGDSIGVGGPVTPMPEGGSPGMWG